jgi:hypothetical protein
MRPKVFFYLFVYIFSNFHFLFFFFLIGTYFFSDTPAIKKPLLAAVILIRLRPRLI